MYHEMIAKQLQEQLPPGLMLDIMQNMWGETVWSFRATRVIPNSRGGLIFPDEDVFTTTDVVDAEAFTRAARIGAEASQAVRNE